jgi:hypothetical protein
MSIQHFKVKLEIPQTVGAWTYFILPFNVEEVFNQKGQVKVAGTINGVDYRSVVTPRDDKMHYMIVNKHIQQKAGLKAGEEIDVVMSFDDSPRIVKIPLLLKKALELNEIAKALFQKLSYTNQKGFVEWINNAKKLETRHSRVGKAIEMILAGKKIK